MRLHRARRTSEFARSPKPAPKPQLRSRVSPAETGNRPLRAPTTHRAVGRPSGARAKLRPRSRRQISAAAISFANRLCGGQSTYTKSLVAEWLTLTLAEFAASLVRTRPHPSARSNPRILTQQSQPPQTSLAALDSCAAIWYHICVLRKKSECSLTYRSGRKAGRRFHASGEAEWSVYGVGNLTRAAYAIAYDA